MNIAIELYTKKELFKAWKKMLDLGYNLDVWHRIYMEKDYNWIGFDYIKKRGGLYIYFDLDEYIMTGWDGLYNIHMIKYIPDDMDFIINHIDIDSIDSCIEGIKLGLL